MADFRVGYLSQMKSIIKMYSRIFQTHQKGASRHWFALVLLLYVISGCGFPTRTNKPIEFGQDSILFENTTSQPRAVVPTIQKKTTHLDWDGTPLPDDGRFYSYYRIAYYKDGKPVSDSLAYDYYRTGEIKGVGYLLAENPDKYHGERITYYKTGQMNSSQTFRMGIPIGKSLFFREDGTVYHMAEYDEGEVIGSTDYYPNGVVKSQGVFNNGAREKEIMYDENGNLQQINTFYDTTSTIIQIESFYPSGAKKAIGLYKQAPDFITSFKYIPIGNHYFFDEHGGQTTKNYDPKPTSKPRIQQRSSTWERGYDYGWEVGYQDGVNGEDLWCSYDEGRKGGQFLDGYHTGYYEGYQQGNSEWKDKTPPTDEEDDW